MGHRDRHDCSVFREKLLVAVVLFALCLLCLNASSASILSLPSSLQAVEEEAFFQATSLDEVVIPNGITAINSKAFAYSTLQKITFPRSIIFIAEDAFEGCQQFSVDVPTDCYAYTWCMNHGYIPKPDPTSAESFEWQTINGLEVKITKYIGSDNEVIIPEIIDDYDVVEIAQNAFKGNTNLTCVYIPGSIRTIGSHAFQNCSNLSDIDFSYGLIDIGAEAFARCSSLSYANLPDSLEGIGEGAFRECTNLEGFHYPASLYHRNSLYDNGHLYDGNIFKDCSKLTSYTIPEGSTTVCEGLFYGANKLQSISLPSTLKEIGSNSFRGCVSLESIDLPDGVVTIHDYAFASCTAITTLNMPNTIKTIESHAFMNCSALATIAFSDHLLDIGSGGFADCSALTSADLPDSLVGLGEGAFSNCVNMTSIHYPLSLDHRNSLYDNGFLYDGKTFYNCQRLRSVTIPEGVTKVPDGIFMGANYLREVSLPSTLTTIEANAFSGCESIRSITIPETVTTIGNSAFENCTALRSITLPNNILSLGACAFKSCTSLSAITFPTGLKSLGAGVFEECTALLEVNLPDSVEGLGERAFYGCKKLNSFHYPRNLDHLVSLYDNGNFYEGNVFYNCSALKTIEIPNGVTKIPGALFAGSNYLETVIVPDTVTKIGGKGLWWSNGQSFKDCVAMEKIYIGPNVTFVGDDTFAGCTNITVWCEYGSVVLQHCKDNNIPYYYLTPDGVNSPSGTLYEGDPYCLHGFARASIPLTNITATIWNSNKSEIIQTISVTPEKTDYDLSGTVNAHMLFGQLALGSYNYTLTASTEWSEETWADNSFRIIEQPLWMNFSGFENPGNYLDSSIGTWQLSGVIRANYEITNVVAKIIDENGTVVAQTSKSPNAKYYSLSNMYLNIENLQGNNYTCIVSATAKNETRQILRHVFGANDATNIPIYTDEMREEIENYIRTVKAGLFLPGDEVNRFLSNMSFWDKLWMGLSDYNGIAASQAVDWMTGSEYSSYMEKKYEAEIAKMINDMFERTGFEEIKISTGATDFIKEFNKIAKGATQLGLEEVQDELDEMIKECGTGGIILPEELKGWEMLRDEFKRISNMYDNIEITELFLNMCSDCMRDYSRDLAVLDVISEAYSGTGNSEFTTAIHWMRTEYRSQYGKALRTAFNYLDKELKKEISKKLTSELLSLAMAGAKRIFGSAPSGASASALYSIVDTACQITIKLSGTAELGSNRIDVTTQIGILNGLNRAFSNASYDIAVSISNGNPPSDSQIYKLQTLFKCGRQELIRLYKTMKKTDTAYAERYEQLIHEAEQMSMPGVPGL